MHTPPKHISTSDSVRRAKSPAVLKMAAEKEYLAKLTQQLQNIDELHSELSLSPKKSEIAYYPNTHVRLKAHQIEQFQQELYGPKLQPKLKRLEHIAYGPDDPFNPAVSPKTGSQELNEQVHATERYHHAVQREIKTISQSLKNDATACFNYTFDSKPLLYDSILRRNVSPLRLERR